MKKKLLTTLTATLLVTSIVLLSACGNTQGNSAAQESTKAGKESTAETESKEPASTADTLSVAFWDQNQRAGIQEIVDEFTRETGIQAELNLVPWGEYWTMLEASASGEDMPDVVMMHNNEIQRYMSNDLLLDLTDMINESEIMEFSRFPQSLIDVYSLDGSHYAIPHEISSGALWYNIDMFEEAGVALPTEDWTWDDLYDAAVALTKEDGSQYGFNWAAGENQTGYWNTIYSMGGYVINSDMTQSGFDQPGTIRAMEFTSELVKNAMPPMATMAENSSEVLFGAGKIAMITTGSWNIPTFEEMDFFKGNVGVTLIPKDKETGGRVSITNGNAWSVAAATNMPEEAKKLVEWFGTEKMQLKLAESGVTMSALEGTSQAWADSYSDLWDLSPYVEMLNYGVNRPYSRNATIWEFGSNDIWTLLWEGKITAEEACRQVYDLMTDALAEEQR